MAHSASQRREPRAGTRIVKRAIDLAITVPVCLFMAPLFLLLSALIKLRDRGPVFYSAARVGLHGKTFTMYKFRTMVINAESLGGSSTSTDDRRITSIGHTLRRWKLDELPQLINVIRGDMSLVGPRPQVRWDVERYTGDECRLLSVRPGMTDWASIRFSDEGGILQGEPDPDEAYDRLIRPEKIRLGLAYVDQISLRTDIRILRDTLQAIASGRPEAPDAAGTHGVPPFFKITEGWSTPADAQQWKLASQRYSTAAALGRGKDLLEVGCGTGYGLAHVAAWTRSAVGLDIDERNMAVARARASRCTFILGSAEDLPLPDESIDCVAGLEMLYYTRDQGAFFSESYRCLRTGGTLLVSIPNPERTAFHPSPFSSRYPTYTELSKMMAKSRFECQIFGACPVHAGSRAKEFARRALVHAHLIPRTVAGRAKLKRLGSPKMRRLETIKVDPDRGFDDLVPLADAREAAGYAILVGVGRK